MADTFHLKKIFSDPALREQFSPFLDNVLRQIQSDKFWPVIDTINHDQSDNQLYADMLKTVESKKSSFDVFHKIKALHHQKTILGNQAQQLLGNHTTITDCVEIGTPGTYMTSMNHFLTIKGDSYVINDKQSWSDYAQALTFKPRNGFLPNNRFVPLNDYAPIKPEDIPSNSIDLVICFIGLHHIQAEKLDEFITSIHRILRPGGVFLLREHNVINSTIESIVHAAHSTYNAIMTGETVETETHEYRNFRPLHYWIELLEQHGLKTGSERLLQNGDPSLNTMIKFTKITQTHEEKLSEISHDLKQDSDYQRPLIQSYLSTPEWHNVDIAQEYGSYINHTPFYEFPYLASVKSFWTTFAKSWKTAAAKKGHLKVLTNEYTLMNLFVGTTMTIEYAAKALISLPIRLMYSGQEPQVIKMIIDDPQNELGVLTDDRHPIKVIVWDGSIKLIEIPRYKKFFNIMHKMISTSIKPLEIAGQKEIQFKVRYNVHTKNNVNIDALIETNKNCKKEYTWTLPTQPDYIYAALTVPVSAIKEAIQTLKELGVEILHMHDY